MGKLGEASGLFAALVSVVVLAGCAPTSGVSAEPNSPGAPAAETEAEPSVSVLDVDVCAWISPELGDSQVMFSPTGAQTWTAEPTVAYRSDDGSASVSCNIYVYDSEETSPYEEVGRVTLSAGKPDITDGFEGESLTHGDVPLLTRIVSGGTSRAVAQLGGGATLSVEAGGNDLLDSEAVGYNGVLPLLRHLVDAWEQDMVPRYVSESFGFAVTFCDRFELEGWEQQLTPADDQVVVSVARGSVNFDGSTRDSDQGVQYEGAVECGYLAVPGEGVKAWPWSAPDRWGNRGVTFKFEQYADAASSSGVVERHADSTDYSGCSTFRRIGGDAGVCDDGSGIAGREDVAGDWIIWGDIDTAAEYTPESGAALAQEMDATMTAMQSILTGLRVDATATVNDPRYANQAFEGDPPADLTCDSGDPMNFLRSARGSISTCIDPSTGEMASAGEIDGVPFELTEGSCGPIDASKWGGDENGTVCDNFVTLTVTSGQGPETHVREYYVERWFSPDYGYGH